MKAVTTYLVFMALSGLCLSCSSIKVADVDIKTFGQMTVEMKFKCKSGEEATLHSDGVRSCPLASVSAESAGLSEIGGGTIGSIVGAAASVFGGGNTEVKVILPEPAK